MSVLRGDVIQNPICCSNCSACWLEQQSSKKSQPWRWGGDGCPNLIQSPHVTDEEADVQVWGVAFQGTALKTALWNYIRLPFLQPQTEKLRFRLKRLSRLWVFNVKKYIYSVLFFVYFIGVRFVQCIIFNLSFPTDLILYANFCPD